jgi:hypothetical protein
VNGAPPGTGTPANPYTSIAYAIAQPATLSGDTLLVAPGNYLETFATGNKRLTFRARGGALATTIQLFQGQTIALQADGSILDGFTITGHVSTGPMQSAVQVANGLCIVRCCILRNNYGTALLSTATAYVNKCTIADNAIGVRATALGGFVGLESSIVSLNTTNVIDDNGTGGVVASWSLVGVPDPGFWDFSTHDLNLRPGSPAINAGNPMAGMDPDGSVIDSGALRYDPTYAPGPNTYCFGKINSQNCVPAIGWNGTPSASSGTFTISCANLVPNKPGLMFFGFDNQAQPFFGGLLCVTTPLKRVGLQNSGGSTPCSGTFGFDMGSYIQSGAHPGLEPGALVFCQWWARDPMDPGYGTSLSNALRFGIEP